MLIHVVQEGETLWLIANRYNVNMEEMIAINGLQFPNQLLVGQALLVPVSGFTYIVQSGDTVWSIAQKFGVSPQAIIEANQLGAPDILQVARKLFIPGIHAAKPEIEVNAYTYQSPGAGVNTLNQHGDLLTYFSPFAYLINEDGSLQPFDDTLMIEAAIAKQIVPMMSITNFTSTQLGSNLAHVILDSPALSETVITNALQVMDEKGYQVLNIDLENVLPEDRENYNRFLQMAVDLLHPKGYLVSTALAPKVSGSQPGLLYEAHDYPAHGRIADFVILMTYEWGYRFGPPQAISPLNQIRRVVEYAVSVIPPEKIFLGFQIYARDWLLPHQPGQEAETFSPQEAIRRAVMFGAEIKYHVTAESPYFNYVDEVGREHEVWFEDARSAQAKFDLVKEFNLRGISYWALGYSYPQNWVLLEDTFVIRKLM